jgi:uncharacterized LabA/DUF88 family protein
VKTVWIVDGAYLFNHGRTRPFDYLKLKNELLRLNDGPLLESHYIAAQAGTGRDADGAFLHWMKSAPPRGPQFRVRLHALKDVQQQCPACNHEFVRPVQKGVDVAIATLAVKLAAQGVYDRLILAAGDGDFEDAVACVKSDFRKEVWLLGSTANLSPDLQCYADRVLWLEDLSPAIDK